MTTSITTTDSLLGRLRYHLIMAMLSRPAYRITRRLPFTRPLYLLLLSALVGDAFTTGEPATTTTTTTG